MEEQGGILDIGNSLSSFKIGDEVLQVPMEHDYVQEDLDKKGGSGAKDFTAASSTAIYLGQSDEIESEEEELVLSLNEIFVRNSVHEPCFSDGSSSEDDTDAYLNQPLVHLSLRQAKRIKRLL